MDVVEMLATHPRGQLLPFISLAHDAQRDALISQWRDGIDEGAKTLCEPD